MGLYGVYGVSGLVLDALFSRRVIGVLCGSHHKLCVRRRERHGDACLPVPLTWAQGFFVAKKSREGNERSEAAEVTPRSRASHALQQQFVLMKIVFYKPL